MWIVDWSKLGLLLALVAAVVAMKFVFTDFVHSWGWWFTIPFVGTCLLVGWLIDRHRRG
jgi:uncharacterized membrane protein